MTDRYKTTRKTVTADNSYGLTELFRDCALVTGALVALPVILWAMHSSDKDREKKIEDWNAANVPGWNRSEGRNNKPNTEEPLRSTSPAATHDLYIGKD